MILSSPRTSFREYSQHTELVLSEEAYVDILVLDFSVPLAEKYMKIK